MCFIGHAGKANALVVGHSELSGDWALSHDRLPFAPLTTLQAAVETGLDHGPATLQQWPSTIPFKLANIHIHHTDQKLQVALHPSVRRSVCPVDTLGVPSAMLTAHHPRILA
jgi:hypothetical protein